MDLSIGNSEKFSKISSIYKRINFLLFTYDYSK
jgi:hypothetical protein